MLGSRSGVGVTKIRGSRSRVGVTCENVWSTFGLMKFHFCTCLWKLVSVGLHVQVPGHVYTIKMHFIRITVVLESRLGQEQLY